MELKTEYSTVIDGKEHQLEEFEAKLAEVEANLGSVIEERESALKDLAQRDDQIIRYG